MSSDIQRFQTVLNNLLRTGQQFNDQEFPPHPTRSIGGPYSRYTFKRATGILKQSDIFSKGIEPTDIKQGALKDSYLLSSLAALAEQPELIQRLFITEEINKAGLYGVWICENGTWKIIMLDDFIPCRTSSSGTFQPAFSQCRNGELWVALLEKAYAKIHGSYYNIENGLSHYALRDFTGAPVQELYDEADVDKIWNFIKKGLENKFFLTCGTEVGDEEDDNEGLLRGHAYTILEAHEVRSRRGEERIIKMRNPWKNFEWKGDWSDNSDLWTEEIKKQLQYVPNPNDGIFYMTIYDYNKYFPVTWLCRYKRDNYYYSVNFQHTVHHHNVVRLIVPERMEITVSLNQRDRRYFKGTNHPDYFYSYSRILIGKVEKNGLEYITGNASGFERNLQATHVFEPGVYLITCEVNWNQDYYKSFNLSFYSEGEISIEGVDQADLLAIQKNIIKSAIPKIENNKMVTYYGKYGDSNIKKTVDCIHGIFYFHYENNSKKKNKLFETVKFSQITNLKICAPFTNDNQFDITILAGSEVLVLYKATLDDFSWGYSASFYIQPPTKEDERLTPNVYEYIDNPANRFPLEVNDVYNLYIRSDRNVNYQSQSLKVQEDEKEFDENYYEVTQDPEKEHFYYYPSDNNKPKESKRSTSDRQTQPKIIKVNKPPKIYPDLNMQPGQINSKRIPYRNLEDRDKEIIVSSGDPRIVFVKNPRIQVKRGEAADIRLRFIAPSNPGMYIVKLEIRSDKDAPPEEVLQFSINNSL